MNLFDKTKQIEIDGEIFAYRESKTAGENAECLVLLHGWPEHSLCWKDVIYATDSSNMQSPLSDRYRIIAPDLRGLGASNRNPDWKLYIKKKLAQDIIKLLQELKVDSFHLAGHDWGGAVAQEVTFASPDRIKSLTLMNILLIHSPEGWKKAKAAPSGPFDLNWYQSFQMTDLAEKMIPGNEAAFLGYILRTPKGESDIPESHIESYVKSYQIPGTPTTGANFYRALVLDLKNWLKHKGSTYGGPTLLLWGVKDPVITPDFLEGHKKAFPESRVERIEAGHFLQEERPAEVAGAINRFINNLHPQ